jgi:hypothetical protein
MKKIFLCLATVVAITVVAAWNVSQNKNEMALTDVALANVEALADELSGYECWDYGCKLDWEYNCSVYYFGSYVGLCPSHRGS